MAGGKFDSSLTRVQPVLTWLRDNGGRGWLRRLIQLASRGREVKQAGLDDEPVLVEFEKPLTPPRALLEHYLRSAGRLRWPNGAKFSDDTTERRKALLAGDPGIQREALALLARARSTKGSWFAFEGDTMTDAIITTPGCAVVIEGKRTEPGLTCGIEWDANREQVYRNLDCAEAWAGRPPNCLVLLVVQEGSRCERDARALDQEGPTRALRSIPQRTSEEVTRVWTDHFAGWTTWEAISREWPSMRLP